MKNFNDFDCKYGLLFNVATLHIVANILMSYLNFQYFDQYSIKANIFVSVVVISFSLIMLFNDNRNHRRPIILLWSQVWEEKKYTKILTWVIIFTLLCLNNFVMIRYFSVLVELHKEFQMTHESFIFFKMAMLAGVLAGLILGEFHSYFRHNREYKINNDIKETIDKYNLDFNKTHFFIQSEHVHGFQIGSYIFRLYVGLFDGERWHSSPAVLDYLKITGIGFNQLDDGHVKNIEMYAIGS